FVKWIWPRIRAYVPEARLRLVGVGLSEGMRAEFCRFGGVEAIGYVSVLSEEYANARAVVVLITEGGGTKIKVVGAAAFGRAALISAHSWRGYERVLPHGRAAHVAQDDEELVRGGVLLLSNYAYAYSLGLEARSVAEREFGFAAFARIVTNTVEICL